MTCPCGNTMKKTKTGSFICYHCGEIFTAQQAEDEKNYQAYIERKEREHLEMC